MREAIEKLQYQPNGLARGLVYKKSGLFSVKIPDIDSPYDAGLSVTDISAVILPN